MRQKLILKIRWDLIVFILLIGCQYGCVANKHKYQAYKDMKEFVLDPYNRDGGYLVFFETQIKNQITYEDTYYLQYHLPDWSQIKKIDVKSYFKEIMMGKIILSCEDLHSCLILSPLIMKEYKEKDFEKFVEMYAKYKNEEEYSHEYWIINDLLSENEKLTVAYCFYLNNIYTRINWEDGRFYSCKDLSIIRIEMTIEDLGNPIE
jgi:hypothetical protein